MNEFKRLTTENPQGNMENMLNITKVINHQVYIRNWNGEGDLNLVDYCKEQYKNIYGRSIDADLEEKITAEEFGDFMDDDDLLSLFYWTAVGYTELRHRLSAYEDTGLRPEEVQRVNDFEKTQCAKLLEKNGQLEKSVIQMQKAYALACRCLTDNLGCPAGDGDADFPECTGETNECGKGELWECWQRYFTEKAEAEAVCRICGCTHNNACEGGCYWVEEDLCSECVETENYAITGLL